jgi:hypothetical protein
MLALIMILVVILLIVALYISFRPVNKEKFDTSLANKGSPLGSTEKKPFTGTFNSSFNGRMAVDDQYFYDKLFDDVVYYPNEYGKDLDLGELLSTGWERCKMECPGHCVEYGIGGATSCFSY